MRKSLITAIAASAIGLACVQPAFATDSIDDTKAAATRYVDDASITASIKSKFAKDDVVRTLSIGVETKDGVVQLSGFGKSLTEKHRAEEIAMSVKGVKRVENDISLNP